MEHTNVVDEVAQWVVDASLADIEPAALQMLKRNVLDTVACAVGALDGDLITPVRAHVMQFSSRPTASLIGGGRASVDQAAFYNAVLVRYPDLLDTFLTPGGLCHPADNFGAILAAAEHVGADGSDFLLALAIAYEVQCRFSAQVPVMARGFNHALQLAMSASAGCAKLFGLDASQTAAAIAAATVDNLSLAAVHAEPVSNWKGISPAITGMRAVYITLLAGRGITGPRALFDGPNGLEQLFDQRIDMHTEDTSLNIVECTYLKQYCSLIHGQAVIDATLALRSEHQLTGAEVDSVTVEVFQGAYDFAGGGSYGGKDLPTTKEQADYNLKYLTAVALLDGQVGPEQLENDRIMRPDVQRLLARVVVKPASDLTAAYPERTSTRVHVLTTDGRTFSREQSDFEGSPTSPMSWERVVEKFEWLGEPFADCSHRAEIASAVRNLDQIPVSQFADLLAGVSSSARRPRSRGRL